jgi:opacity protein-like surface antigen
MDSGDACHDSDPLMTHMRVVSIGLVFVALTRPMLVEAGQATVGAVVAATTSIDSKTELSIAMATGYRVSPHVGFGLELMSVPDLKPDGHATVFTTNVRLDIAPTARINPYVVGGGGIANVRETSVVIPPAPFGLPVVMPSLPVTQSSTELVLGAGGGVGFPLAGHVSAGIDLRYLRLIESRDRNVGRFGVGVSYGF